MIIGIDMDGVLCDWSKTYDEYLDQIGPDANDIPRTKDQPQFNLWQGRTEHESEIIHRVMDTPGFYKDLDPMPGAIQAVHDMIEDGHIVYFVTAPHPSNPTCADDKIAWVRKHFGSEFVDKLIIITRDKTAVNCHILIDDRPDISGQLFPPWKHVFFTQPWNKNITDGRKRINSWTDDWESVISPLIDYAATAAAVGREVLV